MFNRPSLAELRSVDLSHQSTTIHLTFGSVVMTDFVRNWFHFARRAQLKPALVGTVDIALFQYCALQGFAAVGISGDLDILTHTRRGLRRNSIGNTDISSMLNLTSEWTYSRHHKSSFLQMGLVKVALLWELVSAHFNVLISDLDVVWLTPDWQRCAPQNYKLRHVRKPADGVPSSIFQVDASL